MGGTTSTTHGEAWAFTDLGGLIESVSPTARTVLGQAGLGRGHDLLEYFPVPRKALLSDIQSAIQGWPARRTVTLDRIHGRPLILHYIVSRRLQNPGDGEGLYWHLRLEHALESASAA